MFCIGSIFEFLQNQEGATSRKKNNFCESLSQEKKKKMSDAGVNPHLEGIISDFEGLSFIFSIFPQSQCLSWPFIMSASICQILSTIFPLGMNSQGSSLYGVLFVFLQDWLLACQK